MATLSVSEPQEMEGELKAVPSRDVPISVPQRTTAICFSHFILSPGFGYFFPPT